jgi:hypothetical protein
VRGGAENIQNHFPFMGDLRQLPARQIILR